MLICSCERSSSLRTDHKSTSAPAREVAHFARISWQAPGEAADTEKHSPVKHARLLLRSSMPNSADLLLRNLTSEEAMYVDYTAAGHKFPVPESVSRGIVRYTPGAEALEELPVSAWDAATGEVCDCLRQQLSATLAPFTFDPPRFKDRPIQTIGAHFQRAAASALGHYVAIVSASGELHQPLISHLGGARATGPYYQQVFRKTDGTAVGEVVRLPFSEQTDWTGPCWSNDDKYIVYIDFITADSVWIVETGLRDGD